MISMLPRMALRSPDANLPRVHWAFSSPIIASIYFFTDYGEIRARRLQRIGFPGVPDRRHFNLGLQLAPSPRAAKSKLPGSVLVKYGFAGRSPNHLEGHPGGSGERIQRWPPRLIDYRHILHLQRHRLPIGTNIQTSYWYGNHPVKSGSRNWRVQIVNLVCRDRRSLE